MPSTYQSKVIIASMDAIWKKLSNFHDMSWAPNVLPSCEKTGDKDGHEIGARRVLNSAFQETLIELNKDSYSLKYSIDDGPSPVSKDDVSDYVGAIQLKQADGGGTLVEWTSSWESNTEDAVDFCHAIYVALLSELEASFH